MNDHLTIFNDYLNDWCEQKNCCYTIPMLFYCTNHNYKYAFVNWYSFCKYIGTNNKLYNVYIKHLRKSRLNICYRLTNISISLHPLSPLRLLFFYHLQHLRFFIWWWKPNEEEEDDDISYLSLIFFFMERNKSIDCRITLANTLITTVCIILAYQ